MALIVAQLIVTASVATCSSQQTTGVTAVTRVSRTDIVFIYLAAGSSMPFGHYARSSLQVAKTNNPGATVTLITDCSAPSPPLGIQIVNATVLVTQQMRQFEQLYVSNIKPAWIERRLQWSSGHMLRYFYLREYMLQQSVTAAYYIECDVLIVRELRQLPLPCDNYLLAPTDSSNLWGTGRWTAWAGTSILTLTVLDHFMDFSIQLLSTQSPLLEQKGTQRPHLTDMAFWYIFVAASSAKFRQLWRVPANMHHLWPSTIELDICPIQELGLFDSRDGDFKSGFKGWRVPGFSTHGLEYTLHLCCARKHVLNSLVLNSKYPEEPQVLSATMLSLCILVVCIIALSRLYILQRPHLGAQAKSCVVGLGIVVIGAAVLGSLFVRNHGGVMRSWFAHLLDENLHIGSRDYT